MSGWRSAIGIIPPSFPFCSVGQTAQPDTSVLQRDSTRGISDSLAHRDTSGVRVDSLAHTSPSGIDSVVTTRLLIPSSTISPPAPWPFMARARSTTRNSV